LAESDRARLSVTVIDVSPGHEREFEPLARQYEAVVARKGFGAAQVVRDESVPTRFYAARYWKDASCAERCHADGDVRAVTAKIYQIARVSHVVNGARKSDPLQSLIDDRRLRVAAERRAGFDRRIEDVGSPTAVERRSGSERRIGLRRLGDQAPFRVDLVGAARHAREYAQAAYSKFKVGAALEAADGSVITGCNVENATYGLTMCAERVAMFKAISEGHHAFTRIAVVADTAAPTPPCGACRQILWEFGGNLEVILANLTEQTGTATLKELLPLPFDARLL
jgi:cytidine deaminase